MDTQLAATPTLRGQDAKIFMDSLIYKPTSKSKENGKKLTALFEKLEKKGNLID